MYKYSRSHESEIGKFCQKSRFFKPKEILPFVRKQDILPYAFLHFRKFFLPQALGIIPARYASTRFPGKPLALIQGISLLQRTYSNTLASSAFAKVVIATDDPRIYEHATGFGATVVMTSPSCANGTERLAETLQVCPELLAFPITVNIQGDEPCLPPPTIKAVIQSLEGSPQAVMATAVCPLTCLKEICDPTVVKCVVGAQGQALYFSRSPIPAHKPPAPSPPYLRHIGIYAYRTHFLTLYRALQATPLQQAEDLEQLKVLEHGYQVQTALVAPLPPGVDTPADIVTIERWLCTQNSFSSPEASALPLEKG